MSTCAGCKCDLSTDNTLPCGHSICFECIQKIVEEGIKNKAAGQLRCPINSCDYLLQPNEIQQSILEELFNSYLDSCLQGFLEQETDLIPCPNEDCLSLMDFIDLDVSELKKLQTSEITQKGEDGRKLSRSAWVHFNQFRLRCRECQQDFCANCKISPYHLGMNCEQYIEYQKAKKCRFCQSSLLPGQFAPLSSYPALQNCCKNEVCIEIREMSCEKTLKCSHYCGGGRGELKCLPCLEEECIEKLSSNDQKTSITLIPSQNKHDFCPICWVSQLGDEPSIQLIKCGHIVHLKCAQKVIQTRWNTAHIHFAFQNCPLCQIPMDHELLQEYLDPILQLRQKTIQIGLKVFEDEKNMTDETILADPTSEYYEDKEKYILAKMTFFLCSKVCHVMFIFFSILFLVKQRNLLFVLLSSCLCAQ